MKPLRMPPFLSASKDDVREAIDMGFAAGHVVNPGVIDDGGNDLRIVLDFDGALADDSAERVFQTGDLDRYRGDEGALTEVPIDHGPMADFLKRINRIQGIEDSKSMDDSQGYWRRTHVTIVTARSTPTHERATNSIGQWGLGVSGTFLLGGLPRGPILEVPQSHVFFDGQRRQVGGVSPSAPSVHVPSGEINRE